MEENVIIERLNQIYPNHIIFQETYTKAGFALHHGVYSLAKSIGMSSKEWLRSKGFQWQETGYVEPDMQSTECELNRENLVALAEGVIRCYPLIGQFLPTDEEKEQMALFAQDTVRKMCIESTCLSKSEELVLTVSIIEFLKNWNNDLYGESNSTKFWEYIYLQCGFNPENSEIAGQQVYHRFCSSIKNTLLQYNKYFAPVGTKRYYTSMLLHAIAPQQSIENLFNILFDFYVKNLDYQYFPQDTSYQTFVKGMQARWNESSKEENAIRLRSDTVMSGLKTLFGDRPGYMAVKCDDTVRKMDKLLRGESFTLSDRWDTLLKNWYEKKSSIERIRLQGEKRAHRIEYVATSSEKIRLQYELEEGKVGITAPRIRLPDVRSSRPILTIRQEERDLS